MELGKVYTDSLTIPERMRALDESKVADLAKSMEAIGLQQPISVWSPDEKTAVLVAGHHRFAAAVRLGWDEIDCIFVNMDETDRRLWEISENLHRSELTVQERAEHIAEWVRLTEAKHVLRQLDAKPQVGRPEGGVRAAARELGLTEPEARRAVQIAGISDDAKEAVREAGLGDNQSALLEVARTPANQQVTKVAEIQKRRQQGSVSSTLSIPRDPVKAAEKLSSTLSLSELTSLLEVLLRSLKERQEKEAA
ncbi:ParB/RepB/Spo0J family partition protein [Azospirillum sp.]|uniref:ParB/RepB/Spo0J family partition protein n=1 Tax=Azospirillum sp. TaxID=34012 RepID=UPI003D715944